MQSRDFCFWLNGFFELGGGADGFTTQQVALVKQHLALVFEHDASVNRGVGTHPAPQHPVPNPLPRFPYPGTSGEPLPPMPRVIC